MKSQLPGSDARQVTCELAESQHFLNIVMENMPSPVIVYDPTDEARYLVVNRAYEVLFGVSREFVVGRTNFDLLPPGEARLTTQLVLDVAAGRDNPHLGMVKRYSTTRGDRYIRGTLRVIRGADDMPKYVVSILEDLTDLHHATRQAQLEEERANLYLRVADTAVLELSPDGRVLRANRKVVDSLGAIEGDYTGRLYRDVPFTLEGSLQPCDEAFRHIAEALENTPADDDVRAFEASLGASFFRWKLVANRQRRSGALISLVLVGDDVTEINRRRLEAERASRAKSEFLANMSHELRTPLNAIIGYSEMLEEVTAYGGCVDEPKDLARISSAGRHLLELINNILEFSRIEAERMATHVEPFDLAALVDDAGMLVSADLLENANVLTIDGSASLPLCSDRVKVKQILLNLLHNAAKFTRQGRVEVRYQLNDERARIEVSDTGIGMSAAQVATVFEAFVQGDGSTSREFGGTGLGLAICEKLCELLGGSVTVTSTLGEGTTFVVTLPQLDPAGIRPG